MLKLKKFAYFVLLALSLSMTAGAIDVPMPPDCAPDCPPPGNG